MKTTLEFFLFGVAFGSMTILLSLSLLVNMGSLWIHKWSKMKAPLLIGDVTMTIFIVFEVVLGNNGQYFEWYILAMFFTIMIAAILMYTTLRSQKF